MLKRTLGNTELELSAVGIGTWALGGGNWAFGWGPQDEKEAIAGMLRGLELGVNWIDTAAVYGLGQSELIVGQMLRELGPRQRPLIATKCSRVPQPNGDITSSLRRESIIAECEASLERLDVDVIDLYQVHWPIPDEELEEGWGAMVELQQQGKVRCIGGSNFSVEQMQRVMEIHPLASMQPPYSMIVPDVESGVLPFCGASGIGVVSYSPMYKGLLTGSFTPERAGQLGNDDHRSRDPRFRTPQIEIHLDLVDGLRPIAERESFTLAQLSIAWVLRRSEVTSAIVGVRRPSQIEDTALAGERLLGKQAIDDIEALLKSHADRLAALPDLKKPRV